MFFTTFYVHLLNISQFLSSNIPSWPVYFYWHLRLYCLSCFSVCFVWEETVILRNYSISRRPSPVQIMIKQKQPETVEYFSWVAVITNDARCKQEIKFRIDMAKAAFNKKKTVHQQIELINKEESSKVLHLDYSFVWC